MINVGVIGYGYWGPNIVRNFNANDNAQVISVCDLNEKNLSRVKKVYPAIEVTKDYDELISSPQIDVVAVITPVFSHYNLAKKALEAGKHVFVEKPFTSTSAQAEELIEIAEKKKLLIMVDHTFLFTGAVKKIKEIIDGNELGDIFYYDSTRVNLGLFQHDINVIWDLAPHDLSIIDYLIKEKPTALVATGQSHFHNNLEEIAYITIYFTNKVIGHINVNWLSPVKVRQTLIGGQKKMLVWNDLEFDEKIRIYDKGVDIATREGVYDLLVSYRSGDMYAPTVSQVEALQDETGYFLDCIVNNEKPLNDGYAGLRVVKFLEAADKSIKNKGETIYL